MIMSLKQKEIKFKPRIKLNHNNIFSRPQEIENPRQHLPLQIDINFAENGCWVPLMARAKPSYCSMKPGVFYSPMDRTFVLHMTLESFRFEDENEYEYKI